MKNKLCKRLLVGAMACSLLLSGVGGMNSVYAEESTSEQDSGYDVDKPVIESISIDKQGQTISKDTPVKISVKAYDLGSGIKSVEISLDSESSQVGRIYNSETAPQYFSYDEVNHTYTLTITSQNDLGNGYNGKISVRSVKASDKNGNFVYAEVTDINNPYTPLYWYQYAVEDAERPVIDSITVTQAGQTLNVGDQLEVVVKAHDNVALDTTRGSIYFYTEKNSKPIYVWLHWDEEKNAFYGTTTISSTTYPGTYQVGRYISIHIYDTSGNEADISGVDYSNISFTVKNDSLDIEEPVIKNITMTRVGEKLSAGDSYTITVEATDNVGVDSVVANFWSAINHDNSTRRITLNRQDNTDLYVGQITIDETWYPTEWYLAGVDVKDAVGNELYARSYDGKTYSNNVWIGNENIYTLEELYYVNVVQNGNFLLPNYDVYFRYRDVEGNWAGESVSVPRRTSVKDLSKYAEQLDIPELSGVTLTGWKLSNSGTRVILDSLYDMFAQYDKECVTFNICKNVVYEDGIDEDDVIDKQVIWANAGDKIQIPTFSGYKDLNWFRGEWDHGYIEKIEDIDPNNLIVLKSQYITGDSNEYYAKVTDANISTDDKDNTGDSGNTGDSDNTGDNGNTGDNNNTGNNGNTNGNNGSSDNGSNSGNTNNNGNNNNTNNGGSNSNGSNSTVSPTKPAVTLPETKIAETVTEIKSAKTGATIKVDMDDATVVPKEILKQAQGKDVNVVLEMDGYTWTINGKNIAASDLQDINLEVTRNTNYIPNGVVSTIAGNNPVEQISLTYNGNFGFKADLTINVGKQYYGKYGNLYYYDSDGKMVLMNAGAIDKDGNVTLGFSHASEYAIVITDVPASQNQSDGQAQTGQNLSSPKTGDTSVNYLYIMMMLAGIALFVMLAYGFMKDKSNAK